MRPLIIIIAALSVLVIVIAPVGALAGPLDSPDLCSPLTLDTDAGLTALELRPVDALCLVCPDTVPEAGPPLFNATSQRPLSREPDPLRDRQPLATSLQRCYGGSLCLAHSGPG